MCSNNWAVIFLIILKHIIDCVALQLPQLGSRTLELIPPTDLHFDASYFSSFFASSSILSLVTTLLICFYIHLLVSMNEIIQYLSLFYLNKMLSNFIHFDAHNIFLITEILCILLVCHLFFIHTSTDDHLFYILTNVKAVVMNMRYLWYNDWAFSEKCPVGKCWLMWQFYFQFLKEGPYCFSCSLH